MRLLTDKLNRMDVKLKDVQEWYAKKCNKTVKEFDEYDMFCSKVAYDYAIEVLSIGSVSQQRELLRRYNTHLNKLQPDDSELYERDIDEFLESLNCG